MVESADDGGCKAVDRSVLDEEFVDIVLGDVVRGKILGAADGLVSMDGKQGMGVGYLVTRLFW